MPKVSIVVLNWNQPEYTINCVESILDQSYKDFEILIVDNNSHDDSVEKFEDEFGNNEKIRIIENEENLGYSEGNDVGVEAAEGKYVIIQNNDTEVRENWLENLVEPIESGEHIGAVSAKEIRHNEWQDEGEDLDKDFHYYGSTTNLLGYYSSFERKKKVENVDLVDLFAVKGFSFIYEKEKAPQPFDPDYFIYAEDLYLGWYLQLKGFKNKLCSKAVSDHYHNLTKKKSKKMNKMFVYLGERNRLLNLFSFYETKNLIKILPLIITGILSLNFFEVKKLPLRLRSYLWLLTHLHKVMKKRNKIQYEREVGDEKIIERMSCKLIESDDLPSFVKPIAHFINRGYYFYCRCVGLKTVEFTERAKSYIS